MVCSLLREMLLYWSVNMVTTAILATYFCKDSGDATKFFSSICDLIHQHLYVHIYRWTLLQRIINNHCLQYYSFSICPNNVSALLSLVEAYITGLSSSGRRVPRPDCNISHDTICGFLTLQKYIELLWTVVFWLKPLLVLTLIHWICASIVYGQIRW